MIKKIDHICVVVTDIEKSQNFYAQLGFIKKKSADLSGEWLETLTGFSGAKAKYMQLSQVDSDTDIELLKFIDPCTESLRSSLPNEIGIRHLAFEVVDLDSVYEKLIQRGVEFLSEPLTNPYGKKMVYLRGPDNELLELAEYPS